MFRTFADRMEKPSDAPCAEVFSQTFGALSTPCCLCSGLEIVASNKAFDELHLPGNAGTGTRLLNRLITDHKTLDQLFGFPGYPIETNIHDRKSASMEVIAHPWAPSEHYRLLEWRDNSALVRIKDELTVAQTHDAPTGALLPAAFNKKLTRQLKSLGKNGDGGFLCQVGLAPQPNYIHALNREKRDALMLNMLKKIRQEFGPQTLIARRDTLALNVFLETVADGSEARHLARQLRRVAAEVGREEKLETIIAGASFPQDGSSDSELSEAAELAFGNATLGMPSLFDRAILEEKLRLERLASDMPAAIKQDVITPHFQPVIDSSNGRIKGFEALVRWEHRELGRIIPPHIIAIAQNSDLLHELTAHILRTTVDQIPKWPDHVQFAVNVTPNQLDSRLVDLVRNVVRQSHIDPGRLEIEVTEDALIDDFDASAHIFARLRAIGVAIAMDDFGAGFTSMGNLRKLNFTKIKIDKCISDGLPHDRKSIAIVKSMMFMARELGVDITVEGIETEEQLEFLRAFNCGVQGFVFSPALPKSALPEMRKFVAPSMQAKSARPVIGIGPRKIGAADTSCKMAPSEPA